MGDLEKQVKDLQAKLSTQETNSKKALDEARDAAARREQEFAERLSTMARAAKGKLTEFANVRLLTS